MFYIIATEDLHYYLMNDRLEITQLDSSKQYENHDFSERWKVIGLSEILPFGNIGRIQNPIELCGKEMRYKNGKGRFVLHDLDHGTHRIWGDRIKGIWESRCV